MPTKSRPRERLYPADLLQSPLYSPTCKEAFRVMERLAAADVRRPGSSRDLRALAVETGMPGPAIEQVVHFLRLARLVEAPRSRPASVRLTLPGSRISLLAVVRAVDGEGLWRRCILGLEECSDTVPCPAHPAWKEARAMLERHLETQSLMDLARAVARRRAGGRTGRPF